MTTVSPYSSLSNRLSERTKRTVMDKVRALWKERKLNETYCGEALHQASYLHNHLTSRAMKFRTAHAVLIGVVSDNSKIRTFGYAACLHHQNATRRSKLSDPADLGVYLDNRNCLYITHLWWQNRLVESRPVSFGKDTFPRQEPQDTNECRLYVNDDKTSKDKQHPATFQTTLVQTLVERRAI